MRQLKIIVQYDGTDFSGWLIQKKGTTIQGLLEHAVLTFTGKFSRVTGASRTDAGVHALEQVASFRTLSSLDDHTIVRALNANLPLDIRVLHAEEVSDDFHPRYSPNNKTYSYMITTQGPYSLFLRKYSWTVPYTLNISAMKHAAEYLLGKQDYTSFRAAGCSSKNQIREITELDITSSGFVDFIGFRFNSPIIKINIRANAFLRHMVRNIVGTLVETGGGKKSPEFMKELIELKDRRMAGQTAPACGLFLEKIEYIK